MFQVLPSPFTMFHNFWAIKRVTWQQKSDFEENSFQARFYHEIIPAARGFWGVSIEIYKGLIIIKFLGTIYAMHERTDELFGHARHFFEL